MDIDTLISAVFSRPSLWDKRRKDHSNRNVVDAAWKEISHEMNVEELQLRKKWKSLRDYFVSDCNKKPPDATDSRTKRWQYFDQLLFLKDIVTPRPSGETLKPPLEASVSSQQDALDDSTTGTSIEEETAFYFYQSPSHSVESDAVAFPAESTPREADYRSASARDQCVDYSLREQSRQTKRKRTNNDQYRELVDNEKRKQDYFEQKRRDPEDDDLLHLKSLLPYIKMIPRELRLHFRSRVQNLVAELAFGNTVTSVSSTLLPSQTSVQCYDATPTMLYSSQHTSSSAPPLHAADRKPSVSPHSYHSYESSPTESSSK